MYSTMPKQDATQAIETLQARARAPLPDYGPQSVEEV